MERQDYLPECLESTWQLTQALITNRGKVFELILGQFTQNMLDKIKYDQEYETVIATNNPLVLYSLIEHTLMAQTEHTGLLTTMYEMYHQLHGFDQGTLSNAQYYDKCNAKVDVANALKIEFVTTMSQEYMIVEIRISKSTRRSQSKRILLQLCNNKSMSELKSPT